ncbi:MAG: hypothetical protein ACI38Q_00405 [Candidatus Bruticola sp.]
MSSKGLTAIFMAASEEVQPLLKLYSVDWLSGVQLDGLATSSPVVWKINSQNCLVCLSGMGYEHASESAQLVIRRFKPALLISAGFCGALSASLRAGQVVGIETLLNTVYVQPADSALKIMRTFQEEKAVPGSKIDLVKAITSAKVIGTVREKTRLLSRFGAEIVDMEAGAIAAAAQKFNLPWCAVKAVSDEASMPMPLNFNELSEEDSGQVNKCKVILEVLKRPIIIPRLCRLAENSDKASKNLAVFLDIFIRRLNQDIK